MANQNRLDLRMPLPSDGLDVGYFDLEQGTIKDFIEWILLTHGIIIKDAGCNGWIRTG